MAILPDPIFGEPQLDFEFNVEQYAIGGELITVKFSYDDITYLHHSNDQDWRQHVRRSLAQQLAEAILTRGLCETMTFRDPITGTQTVAARCYLAPRDQVKILRVHKP